MYTVRNVAKGACSYALVLAKHTTNLSVVGCVYVTTPEPTLTAENVARVMEIVAADKRKEMWDVLIVPEPESYIIQTA